jgi:transcriptional regulator with XRE-family HTH domain
MAEGKNPIAVQIGQRIKQARRMAGLDTAAQLLARIPDWSPSRLGNYEAGISAPSPDDVGRIGKVTGASPCWIMFGIGPIRSHGRDTQAIRHQNLVATVEQCRSRPGSLTPLLKALGLSRKKVDELVANPFSTISERIARRCERFLKKPKSWMDEQHVESDPVCSAFPDDMRRMMEIYSNLSAEQRGLLLRIAETFVDSHIELQVARHK